MLPKYLQISDQLRAQLTGNERASIQKLPTEQELCEHFHVSKSYLSSSFARATSTTIFQYKLSLQLEEAKRLCRETRYSYDKIAQLTGFSSGNYFRLIFKKHEGQTPNQHRYNSLEKRNKRV